MSDVHQKKQEEPKNIVNPLVAGIAGAVAGGVAVAVMSDKKNQEKVRQAIDYMKNI